jgi:hypothetical protein
MAFATAAATGDRLMVERAQAKTGLQRTGPAYQVPEGYPNFAPLDGRAILLFEDFEGGMPAGWLVIDGLSDGYKWTVGTTGDLLGYDPPAYGTKYAYYSDDDPGYVGAAIEELWAPAVACAGISNINFTFSWGFVQYDPPYGAVYVRTYNAGWGAWNLLATYTVTGQGIAGFGLGAYLPGDSVQVKFTYEDLTDGWGWAFGVDNVMLEVPPQHDVGCTAVTSPVEGSMTPGLYDVIGTVENFGLNSETFDVTANVYNETTMDVLWTQTQSVSLAAGANTSVNFGQYDFPDATYFLIEIYTALAGDEELSNDTSYSESRTALGLGDVVYELDVETISGGDYQLLGVNFDGEYFYVSGGNSGLDPNHIYVIDTAGALIYTIDQPVFATGWGFGCLAWDMAANGARIDTLYGVTVYEHYVDRFGIDKGAGTLNYYSSFPVPAYYSLGLTYDDDQGAFFGGNFFDSYGVTRFLKNGSWTGYVETPYATFGSAYDTDDDEGGLVYWFTQDDPGTGDGCMIAVQDAVTMDWLGYVPNAPVITVSTAPIAGGLCFYEGFRNMDVLFGLVQGTPDAIVGMFVRYDYGVEATVWFDPECLTFLKRVRCFIELETGYDVNDIDRNSVAIVAINGEEIDPIYAYRWLSYVGDHNDNGIPDLMVRFNRWDVWMALMDADATGPTELTVTGLLDDDSEFEGKGTITVFKPWWWWWDEGDQGYTNLPRVFALNESQPNPFTTSTVINYAIPEPTNVQLSIYDASGRLVKSLVNETVIPGYYNVRWDAKDNVGKDVASGVYFVKFQAGTYNADSKLVLVR